MADPMAQKVVAIIAARAGRRADEVLPETRLDDLGLDSLGQVELAFALEEAFDIRLPFVGEAAKAEAAEDVAGLIATVRDLAAARVS